MNYKDYELKYIKSHTIYKYAEEVVECRIDAPKYIKKQCESFLMDIGNTECPYFLDINQMKLIESITKLLVMATGLRSNENMFNVLVDFQWFFIMNILCWKEKEDKERRRYHKGVFFVPRKNGKSFLVGALFAIMSLLEPKFSQLYSVAPDRELSGIVKREFEQIILSSPAISSKFKIRRSDVECIHNHNKFTPLANSNNRLDGRLASVWVADEVGALPNRYPLDAMESSQFSIKNRLGIIISTAYESLVNPMTQEVEYCKKVLDGVADNDRLFALLYMPDDNSKWLDDNVLEMINPLFRHVPANAEFVRDIKKQALEMPEKLKNFKTKHMNIFVDGDEAEQYISVERLRRGSIKEYDWRGKEVYLGMDLAISHDNCSISMTTHDKELGKYVNKSFTFYPAGREEVKSKLEKVDYALYRSQNLCIATGDSIVDYDFIEEFIYKLEERYGVIIRQIGYDRHNAMGMVSRLMDRGFDMVDIPQVANALHSPTKYLKEMIYQDKFLYEENQLLEINFSNAKIVQTDGKVKIDKKKSEGKIDIVDAIINTMVFHEQEFVEQRDDYVPITII